MPDLLLLDPYSEYLSMRAKSGLIIPHTDVELWEKHFGFAFGTVLRVGANVRDVKPGDFVGFTRGAYLETPMDDCAWLFVNHEDVKFVIEGWNGDADSVD